MNNQREGQQGRLGLTLTVVIAGAFMVILNNSIINVAVPSLMEAFQVTADTIQWVISGYMLAMGVTTPTTGYLVDKLGTKKVYMTGFAIFILGSILGTNAGDVLVLILARVAQGIGGGLIMPVSMVIIYQVVPKSKIGFALGVWGISAMAAPVVGPTLSGYLLQYYSWALLFLVNVPVGILGLWLAKSFLPSQSVLGKTKLDKLGLVLVTATCFSLLYSLSQGHILGWSSPVIIGLITLGLICGILFVRLELSQKDPLLDLHIFRIIPYAMSVLIVGVTSMGLFSVLYLIPIFTQTVQQLTPLETGLILVPAALTTAFTMPIAGKVFDLIGAKKMVMVGLTIMSVATWQLHHIHLDTSKLYLAFWVAVRGLGLGLSSMPATTAGLVAVPEEKIGRASALTNTLRQIFSALGIALFTMVYQLRKFFYQNHYPEGEAAALAIGDAFLVTAIISFAVIPAAFFLGEKIKN